MIRKIPNMTKLWKPMMNSEGDAVEAEEMQLPFYGAYRARAYINGEMIRGRRTWTWRVDQGGRSATFCMARTLKQAKRVAERHLFHLLTAHEKLQLLTHLEAAG